MTTSSHPRTATPNGTVRRHYRMGPGNTAEAGPALEGAEAAAWGERARIVLTPVAAPSILGLYGFFAATLLVGSHMAGWWGTASAPTLVFPFVVMLGGIAQFASGLWAYRARDGLATAMHGIWGAFWLAFGLYQLLVATGAMPAVGSPKDMAFGFWFIPLCAITAAGTLAAAAVSLGFVAVLAPLAAGSFFAALGWMAGLSWSLSVAGWLFVFSAGFAWYTASAMMLEGSFGRTILPTGQWSVAANVPGRTPSEPIEYEHGMPGARAGQ